MSKEYDFMLYNLIKISDETLGDPLACMRDFIGAPLNLSRLRPKDNVIYSLAFFMSRDETFYANQVLLLSSVNFLRDDHKVYIVQACQLI